MLDRLQFILNYLGSNKKAAAYLGYTTRQFYNIRKRLEREKPLNDRLEHYIRNMADQLGYEEIIKRNGHRKNAQSETTQQSRRYSDA